jgi:hypothetical protein
MINAALASAIPYRAPIEARVACSGVIPRR